ncbi:MAG: hypothetical protein HYZ47_05715 [Simkania negevensis]|nr:hypothetical protein [Simkania negevensis]
MNEEEIKAFGKAGFIPGPDEEEDGFLERVKAWQKLPELKDAFLKNGEKIEPKELFPFFKKLEKALAIAPRWIFFFYSNKRLTPWQGGATWVMEAKQKVPYPLVQLRRRFKKGCGYLYQAEELLFHETIHAIRAHFNQPKYEEHLAYYFSKKKIRRFLGPLFRSPLETTFLLVSLLFPILCQTLFFLSESPLTFFLAERTPLVPLSAIFLFMTRLLLERRLFKKTLQKLSLLFPSLKHAIAIAIRMTDEEISLFASLPVEALHRLIQEKGESSLRWKQILLQFQENE